MKTILIVDDEFSIVEALAEIMGFSGYSVITAPDGQAGLDAARAHRPSLILLDYMMPVMDGVQLMARLRADPELKDTPVVMMTAAPHGIPVEARVWNALLVKPFDAANLTSTIDRLVGGP